MKSDAESKSALSGVTVLEWGEFISAPYCTKMMADLGATVIKIEKPGQGDIARRHGPFLDNRPDPELSGLFLYLNANKLGITLNLETIDGQKIFKKLAAKADLLVENNYPSEVRRFGLDYQELDKVNPNLVMTSITMFGLTGPYRDYKGYAINASALGGMSVTVGEPGREPLTPPLSIGHFLTGTAAAIGSMAALMATPLIGKGQLVDIAESDCWTDILVGHLTQSFISLGKKRMRSGHRTPARYPYTILPCKDGYMSMIAVQGFELKRFLELVGGGKVPEWYAKDARFTDRLKNGLEYADELDALLEPWLMAHTRDEIFNACRERGIPFAPIRTIGELVEEPHFKERQFWTEISHPVAGNLKYPGAPYRLSETPWQIRRAAPLLGEHNEQVFCGVLQYTKEELCRLRGAGII